MRAINVGERGKNMRFASLRPDNIFDANAPDKQCVAYHRPVAAPGNCFGAHQDATFRARLFRDSLNVLGKLCGLHVIREASKRVIAPAEVGGISTRMAQAPETRKMGITNFDSVQVRRKRVLIELGIVTRSRYGPHIEHPSDLIVSEQSDERLYRSIGMTDRADKGPCQRHVSAYVEEASYEKWLDGIFNRFHYVQLAGSQGWRVRHPSLSTHPYSQGTRRLRREQLPTGNPIGSLTASTGPTTTGFPPTNLNRR